MPKNKKNSKKNKDQQLLKDAFEKISFVDQIKDISEDLFYISETDSEIIPFTGEKAEAVTKDELLKQTENENDAFIEERDFEEFFDRLTKFQYWYEAEETEQAKKFYELKKLLEENLRELKVFRIGKIEIDIYAVGIDMEGRLAGIKTFAVET